MNNNETVKVANNKDNLDQNKDKSKESSLFNRIKAKSEGALKEFFRQMRRDKEVEKSFSQEINIDENFIAESKKIDEKKELVASNFSKMMELVISGAMTLEGAKQKDSVESYIFNEESKKAMLELEKELTDPFAKLLYEKMGEENKQIILDYLVDYGVTPAESKIIETESDYLNIIKFSDNGFMMQINNKEEVGYVFTDKNAHFNIINPDGTIVLKDLNFEQANLKLKEFVDNYQQDFVVNYNKYQIPTSEPEPSLNPITPEINKKPNIILKKNNVVVKEPAVLKKKIINQNNAVIEPLKKDDALINKKDLDIFNKIKLEEEKNIAQNNSQEEDLKEEAELFNTAYIPYVSGNAPENNVSAVYQINKNELKVDREKLKNSLATEPVVDESLVVEPLVVEPVIDNKVIVLENNFDTNVLAYAEKMGISLEYLNANLDFSKLNNVQQFFILKTLNNNALGRVKVEGNKNYLEEKAGKKWWQVGYAFNQKFHKKEHEVLVAKNIHDEGIKGYGEEDFNWLIDNLQNGPEIIINEEGEVNVNYLILEDVDTERQALLDDYNEQAYKSSSKSSSGSLFDSDFLVTARENLLASAKNNEDEKYLMTKILEAEKNIRFHNLIKGNEKTQKVMEDLIGSSDGGWNKFKMILGSHKDKGTYMAIGMTARALLRSEMATTFLSKAASYSVGPMVAAFVGGIRANEKAKNELREKEQLARLGVKNSSKEVKKYNLAVGQINDRGQVVNFGLADKLNSLLNKIEELEDEIKKIELNDPLNKDEIQKLKIELLKNKESLATRREYTKDKLDDKLISFGNSKEAIINKYKLLDSLMRADIKTLDGDIIADDENKVMERLNNFLDYKEDLRQMEEFKYFVKEISKGAVIGASFAAAAAWIFEHTGLGDFVSSKLEVASKAFYSTKVGVAVDSVNHEIKQTFHSTANGVKSWFNGSGESSAAAKSVSKIIPIISGHENTINNVIEKNIAQPEEIASNRAYNKEVANASDDQTVETEKIPKVIEKEIPKSLITKTKPELLSDEISNKGIKGSDSIWRSTKEIFKTNANILGYQGNAADEAALNSWAETQASSAINNSGELSDKVFEGNKVFLTRDGANYKISIEQGSGPKPDYLNSQDSTPVEEEIVKTPVNIENHNLNVLHDEIKQPELPTANTIEQPVTTEAKNISSDLAHKWRLPINHTKIVDENHLIYETEKGKVIINTNKGGSIEKVVAGKEVVPQSLVNEIKGRLPLHRFMGRDGLDKILSVWKNLNVSEKAVYENLDLFNKNQLTPAALLNKLSGTFNVNTKNVFIYPDKKLFELNNGKTFDMTLRGVNKLVKFLARQ